MFFNFRKFNYNTLIEYRDNGYWLADCESEDGTWIMLPKGSAYPISTGDRLRSGNTEFVFQSEFDFNLPSGSQDCVKPIPKNTVKTVSCCMVS